MAEKETQPFSIQLPVDPFDFQVLQYHLSIPGKYHEV